MSLLIAVLADPRWLLGAFRSTVAFLIANSTFTIKRSILLRVWTVRLVVPNLAAVEALAGHLLWLGTIASIVPGLTTAKTSLILQSSQE